jgi:hypothetical protein
MVPFMHADNAIILRRTAIRAVALAGQAPTGKNRWTEIGGWSAFA